MSCSSRELSDFLANWPEGPEGSKEAFVRLKDHVASHPGVRCGFHPREGITYSLRAGHEEQQERSLFVLIDVIEDAPRWLSVCFYADMINDPDELGDFVPEGLLGEDALCFDLDAYEDSRVLYIQERIDEALQRARGRSRPHQMG